MSYFALWLDKEHAYIYEFKSEGVEETKLHNHEGKTHPENSEKFFHEIALKLNQAKELMVMGPGIAKDQFKHHCESHHHSKLAKAIIGVKSMEAHPTKSMMLGKANEFFKSYHTWTKNY
jgi:stalled ribosome rescue protein Dom34